MSSHEELRFLILKAVTGFSALFAFLFAICDLATNEEAPYLLRLWEVYCL
jgi:hypothetical protein